MGPKGVDRKILQVRRTDWPYDPSRMTADGFSLFETPLGRCGIAWGDRGIVGVQLPEGRPQETRARMLRRFPDAQEAPPPADVRQAIERIVAHLRGATDDLSAIRLDMAGIPPFHRRVYELARTIPPGATLSYGDVAARIGSPRSARAVGQALGRNPFAIVVPCHRVLASGGKVGGFTATGGISTKLRLLAIEGARGDAAPTAPAPAPPALGFDPEAALEHLRTADPVLARLVERAGPFTMRLKEAPSVFAALAEAIVYQQLTAKAAATIFARVCALFPRGHQGLTAEEVLRVSDEKLREAGLSRPKLLSLRDLAEKAKAGDIPTLDEVRGMDDETVVQRLTHVRGIGRWTAEMLLIFRLGRPDVLPLDDYGIRKGFAIAFRKKGAKAAPPLEPSDLPTKEEIEKRGARWRPYRTVASWYLWRAVDL